MPTARKVLMGPRLQNANLPRLELATQAAASVSILQITVDPVAQEVVADFDVRFIKSFLRYCISSGWLPQISADNKIFAKQSEDNPQTTGVVFRCSLDQGKLGPTINFALKMGWAELSPGIDTEITPDTPLYQFVLQHFLHALSLES